MHPLAELIALHGATDTADGEYTAVRRGANPQQFNQSVGDAPCDRCQLRQRCAERLVACQPFLAYVETGACVMSAPRETSRAYYRAAMAVGTK